MVLLDCGCVFRNSVKLVAGRGDQSESAHLVGHSVSRGRHSYCVTALKRKLASQVIGKNDSFREAGVGLLLQRLPSYLWKQCLPAPQFISLKVSVCCRIQQTDSIRDHSDTEEQGVSECGPLIIQIRRLAHQKPRAPAPQFSG